MFSYWLFPLPAVYTEPDRGRGQLLPPGNGRGIPAGELTRLSEEDRCRLVTRNRWSNDPSFTDDYLRLRKKETIENEAAGLLEIMETVQDLSYVSGHDFVKKRFKNAARAIKLGRLDVLPMGYLISGPV
ncbi:MAG: hypothetical protein LBF74_14490, partial [Treponema sp.]|nr:hypothetical protein [Treponema sp.]